MPELNAASMRDELHEIPELGFEEFKTSDYVADKLQKLGIEFVRGVGGTGVLGIIRGAEPGPVMLLRADMDALPFKNADGSIERVHACGHDGHTAMLLAAASRLVGKIRRGTLKLLFQPFRRFVCHKNPPFKCYFSSYILLNTAVILLVISLSV